ncbi:MAG: hypothetical protein ABR555_08895 [Pyrinomonadaceae bacterium]
MYCPSCGSEERQLSQFCRACGTDLRVVRTTLERPDEITASAISAREQISRVITAKIAQMESSHDLETIAEDVLPQLEKFMESPEERRLRRIRAGVITASVGFALTLVTVAIAADKSDFAPFIAPGLVAFLIGLGLVINGLLFTMPRKRLPGSRRDRADQHALDLSTEISKKSSKTNDLESGMRQPGTSVTEHTTHHLLSNRSQEP